MTGIVKGNNFSLRSISIFFRLYHTNRLVEETEDLASNVLSSGLLMVHDTSRGGQDDVTELTRRKQLNDPLLHLLELDVVAGRDAAGLVEAAVELDDNLAVAVVVDLLELSDVACTNNESVLSRL